MIAFVLEYVENIVDKGEIGDHQYFLLLPFLFSIAVFLSVGKYRFVQNDIDHVFMGEKMSLEKLRKRPTFPNMS